MRLPADEICSDVEARLVTGARPGEDPMLAEHIGTCLRCFRTASELRDLPRLEALLHQNAALPDPGETFWSSFPSQAADAWEASQRGAEPAPPLWRRVRDWFRMPVPAALAGAAVAAVVVALAVRIPEQGNAFRPAPDPARADVPGVEPAVARVPDTSERVVAERTPVAAGAETARARTRERSLPEPRDEQRVLMDHAFLESLDASDLEALFDVVRESPLAPLALDHRKDNGTDGIGLDEADDAVGDTDLASVAEGLDSLDESGLEALSRKLGRRI